MTRPIARHVLPELTERDGATTRTMDPYSKLLSERIVFLGTPVDDVCANDVIAQLVHLEHAGPDRDVSLYINSPGGSTTAMSAIYDTMRFITCDVETVCLGQAGSSAAVLLAAGTPGKRLALPNARVVIHQPSLDGTAEGQVADLAIHATELLRTRDTLVEMLVRHTGQSAERIRRDIERDKVFDAEGALAYGLIDQVTESRKLRGTSRPGAR
ncbi:ATP-dependent Clp protease proteolytic subunit [Streptomyces sp. UNOC14_S4]|uniref:ATP-dependent Clp protease proteolytic subunit n=1 Tax=Streptomyces sp. UNOC14_S4 TaxID=2872340 RepID=UPI001E34FEDF|nr:ATP-dependent Clp protease proteolytic subunit [Streptomyces sp. UNOC14_S4]MCC3771171.1 ATP-dependent Clp protease proteolytic subunit [Streptomyces sp. UNOC14_S4]